MTPPHDCIYVASCLFRAGVREVWLLDPEERSIEVRTREGEKRHAGGEIVRSDAVPGFETTCDALLGR